MRIPTLATRPTFLQRSPWSLGLLLVVIASSLLALPEVSEAKVIRQFLADGFDFPVGKPDSYGYYKARGFWPNGHLGEDWNGRGGGNSDLGDPVYAIGRGVVVLSEDYRRGWGNVVIIRHAYRDVSGKVFMVDSQYGHLDRCLVQKYELVKRGQQIGTIGTNRGMYLAHLHLEVHKNLSIGMHRSSFSRGYENYFSPTDFIRQRRKLRTGFRMHPIPVDTFGSGKTSPSRRTSTTFSAEIPPTGSRPKSTPTAPGSTKPNIPKEVEDAIGGDNKPIRESLRSFWEKLKSRLDSITSD